MDSNRLLDLANKALTIRPWPPVDLFPPSRYYRFLQVLAQEMQPALSLELGVCGGGGSLHLAEGWKDGQVVGVDVARDHPDQIAYIQAHYPNFEFWFGDSVESAAEICRRYGPASIVFVDTVHIKKRTIDEFNAWLPYLTQDGIICFDDILRAEMEDFWDWLPGNKVRLDFLHATADGGFGCFWK